MNDHFTFLNEFIDEIKAMIGQEQTRNENPWLDEFGSRLMIGWKRRCKISSLNNLNKIWLVEIWICDW